jgi:hypothetical protein
MLHGFLVCCSLNNGRTLLRRPKGSAMCQARKPNSCGQLRVVDPVLANRRNYVCLGEVQSIRRDRIKQIPFGR